MMEFKGKVELFSRNRRRATIEFTSSLYGHGPLGDRSLPLSENLSVEDGCE